MNQSSRGSFGRNDPSGVMDTFAVRLATPVKQPSASILNNKGEGGQFIHEAEDFVVFLPVGYKTPVVPQQGALAAALFFIPDLYFGVTIAEKPAHQFKN